MSGTEFDEHHSQYSSTILPRLAVLVKALSLPAAQVFAHTGQQSPGIREIGAPQHTDTL